MNLEVIILILILVPIILLVGFRAYREGNADPASLLRQITGIFMLVLGIILLFPAFYLLFYGKYGALKFALLPLSLLLVFSGNHLTKRVGENP